MSKAEPSAVTKWHKHSKQEGFVRLELHVRKEDVSLVKGVVKALGDPVREREARALLHKEIAMPNAVGFKEYLASAPLEGVDLSRPRDLGGDIDL